MVQAPTNTELLFVNHASLLIKYGNEYLLTDPWFQRPAFGSWLPIPPMAVHPSYLAALKGKLRILVSHAHDDHLDDHLFRLFDKNTEILTTDYASKSCERRLRKLGFTNIQALRRAPRSESRQFGAFRVRSWVNETISPDDSIYLIETPDAAVVHCNDMWYPLQEDSRAIIARVVQEKGAERVLYASQTNSASGFPLSYRDLSRDEKLAILMKKVTSMIRAGLKNAADVGARNFLSYAGFASVFVKGKEQYLTDAIFPDRDWILSNMPDDVPHGVQIVDMLPGDMFEFPNVRKGFFGNDIDTNDLKRAAASYYEAYGAIGACDSYLPIDRPIVSTELEKGLEHFLTLFNGFVMSQTKRTEFEQTILGKTFTIHVEDLGLRRSVRFGEGLTDDHDSWNKQLWVSSPLMSRVIEKQLLFEDLYTGFNGEFARNPRDVYNRDIVMYLVMFSYYYMNRREP